LSLGCIIASAQPPQSVTGLSPSAEAQLQTAISDKTTAQINFSRKPPFVRGIHLTSWVAGSKKARVYTDTVLNETEVNTVVIDMKEYRGEVYVKGVKEADEMKTYVSAVPDLKEYLASLKARGIYTVARIVCFKDDLMARRRPEWAVKSSSGGIWLDRSKNAWLDPFNKNNWHYLISIAKECAAAGFEEIQFDYIRFPSDGNIKLCRYSKPHTPESAGQALHGFLTEAYSQLKPLNVDVSIDIFGLVTTDTHDMGIGQKLLNLTESVDYVCPMVYPSHYNPGEYNLADPDLSPYETVYYSLNGAKKRLGESFKKLRPYLQDFSLKHHYGAKQVRDQIQAAYDNDIGDWILWNPRCKYTMAALKPKQFSTVIEKSNRPAPKARSVSGQPQVSSSTLKAADLNVEKSSGTENTNVQPLQNPATSYLSPETTPQIKQ
jgi:hypothetical protein